MFSDLGSLAEREKTVDSKILATQGSPRQLLRNWVVFRRFGVINGDLL